MADARGQGSSGPIFSEFAGDPDMKELIELFMQELPTRVEAIRQAQASGDSATLTRLTHQLRGASAGYGYATLGTAAGQVEDRLRGLASAGTPGSDTMAKIGAEISQLIDLCRRVTMAKH